MDPKLKQWLCIHLPEVVADLNGPATTNQIQLVEDQVGVVFPSEFKSLYLEHNGQIDPGSSFGMFYGLVFLSLERISSECMGWAETVDLGITDADEFCRSHLIGTVKEEYANKKWIPFAYDGCGNYLGLDFDPDKNGTKGQIINFGSDEDIKYVYASSFGEFMLWYIQQLENGNYYIGDSEYHDENGPLKTFRIKTSINMRFFDE